MCMECVRMCVECVHMRVGVCTHVCWCVYACVYVYVCIHIHVCVFHSPFHNLILNYLNFLI